MNRNVLSFVIMSIMAFLPSSIEAAGLNTDVALTPPKGGTILRYQWRFTRLADDPTPLGREIELMLQPLTAVYGISENLAILGTVPIVHTDIDFDRRSGTSDTGVGDIPLLLKYRFYQKDLPGKTTRWAAIGGAEVPTYDGDFSSESLDPIIGTVWTHQERDWWVDWDVLYQFNTSGGLSGDDSLRLDVAYSHKIIGGENDTLGPWGLYAIAEANSEYLTDGSTQVFGSPGLQFITPRWIFEAGVQIPVHQDMATPRLEDDYTAVASVRYQF